MSSVSISDLGKRYGAMSVIEGLSLEIKDGEFIILVGPSGCGKSTLLRMIAGLEEISEGHLYIGDRLVNEVRPRDRNIAMVFQNYALYPHKTVAQNLGFSLMLRGSSRTETDRKVRETAEILGLGPLLDRYPKQLSGGQRQRVAMGRAIVRDPEVFLFDEPLSNLDAKLRVQMRTEIKALHERLKSTIVYVTHDQIEALTMADRIVVMNGGRIEQVGRPLEIYDHPENIFVAGFIGSPAMNMFDGEAIETTAGPCFRITDRLAIPLADRPPAKGSYTLGIRPEHLEIVHDVAMGVPATVLVHEPSGAETQMLFDLAGHRCLGTFKDRIEARPGDVLHLSFPPVRMHFFDRETGQRLNTGARPTAGYAAG